MANLSDLPREKKTCWECNPSNKAAKMFSETLRCILCWRRFKDGVFLDTERLRRRGG